MTTDTDKLAILAKYESCFANLTGEIAVKLGKYKLCDLKDQIREMNITRAFLFRVKKYDTSGGTDVLNEATNCMSKEELCQILNSMYNILDKYCTC